MNLTTVRADFDRLAALGELAWDTNAAYHGFLLSQLPQRMETALDVGSGKGAFTRLLAGRAQSVVGIDVSEGMVRVARERSAGLSIEYQVEDIFDMPAPAPGFDAVASIAMLHHVDLLEALRHMAGLLRRGGTLAVLDLYRAAAVVDRVAGALAFPYAALLRWQHTGRLRESAEVRKAWDAHGRHDKLITLRFVRAAAASALPGARVRRHLLWRYSLVWRKP